MARLVYSTMASLDGYSSDEDGDITWGEPDPEVLTFINDLEREIGTYLYGRGIYESMVFWETFQATDDHPECVRDYTAIWRAASKVVYSRTLDDEVHLFGVARNAWRRHAGPSAALPLQP